MTNFPNQQAAPGTAFIKADSKVSLPAQRLRPSLVLGAQASPWRVILYIGTETVTPMRLEVSSQVVVGRADLAEGVMPSIDLSPFGAQDKGVSRRHASLIGSDEALYIRDLESTNGTTINGFALEANQLYRLRDGDRIELGQMHVQIQIVAAPSK